MVAFQGPHHDFAIRGAKFGVAAQVAEADVTVACLDVNVELFWGCHQHADSGTLVYVSYEVDIILWIGDQVHHTIFLSNAVRCRSK